MKVALNLDKTPVYYNGHINYAAFLPIINASRRDAEIILHTQAASDQFESETILNLLMNIIPGKSTLFFGQPEADLYLGA